MVENVIIMAGGSGRRLWPASLDSKPKQFLKVNGKTSLFQEILQLAFHLGVPGRVYVVTHQSHVEAAVRECQFFNVDSRIKLAILAEPIAKNTAPALTLAASRMLLDGRGGQTCLIMAADHIISPPNEFSDSVSSASTEAEKGFIVFYGIKPISPATGYGYIEIAPPFSGAGSHPLPESEFSKTSFSQCRKVKTFHEKPDVKTAGEYLTSGRHFWNAGIFTYRNDVFLRELGSHAQAVSRLFKQPQEGWFKKRSEKGIDIYEPGEKLRSIYTLCPSISIDYAVMEKTVRGLMIRASFEWSDVGSWDVIAKLNPSPEKNVYSHQSSDNFVYSELPVALCGVEKLIVTVANNRVLICKKGMSQLVREAALEDAEKK